MISIKLFKVVAKVGNPPLCSGVIAIPSGLKFHTFIVILAMFGPQPRWRHKPWKGLLQSIQFHLYEDSKSCVVVCITVVWRQQWHFWDERHCESLKKKMALLDAKHRNRVKCGWCKQQLTTDHFARKPAEHQSGKLLRDVLQKVGALDTQI